MNITAKNRKELLLGWDSFCERIQTATASSITPETYVQKHKSKEAMLADPYEFKRRLFPHYCILPDSPTHKRLNRELAKHTDIIQFRTAFRGFAKSVDADIIMPIYLMMIGQNPLTAIVSENFDKAQTLLASVQAELEANELIHHYFGKQVGFGSWADGEFLTKSGSFFKAFGINQSIHGLRYKQHRLAYAVADDFDKQEFAGNARRVANLAYEIHGNILAAMEGSPYKRLVIAQNYKVKEGVLDRLFTELGNAPQTKKHLINVMSKTGKPTWAERYDEKGIKDLQAKYTPRAFRAEFMNEPSSEGGIIKPEWVQWGAVQKWSKYPCLFLHWDLSYTDQGDYKTCALVGIHDNQIHVLDIFCRKTDIHTAMHYHYDIVQKCKMVGVPLMSSFDSTASQMAVFTPMWQEVAKLRGIFEMPMPVSAPAKDKYLRVEATLSPLLMQGKILFDSKLQGTTDAQAGIDQLLTFEKGSKSHDDFPDALEETVRKAQQNSFTADDLANMKAVTGSNNRLGRKGNRRGKKGF